MAGKGSWSIIVTVVSLTFLWGYISISPIVWYLAGSIDSSKMIDHRRSKSRQ